MKFCIIYKSAFMIDNNIMIKQLLGKRIKEIRKSRKLTQEQLAEFINIETSSISNIESGKYYPTAENLDKIINVLNVTPQELFQLEHNKNNETLIEEMTLSMKNNAELTKLMYKFYLTVKF